MSHRGRADRSGGDPQCGLMTVEGEKDDISGVGQTHAAQELCVNIPESRKHYHLRKGVGHFGVFNGSRFRKEIAPRIREFIAMNDGRQAAQAVEDQRRRAGARGQLEIARQTLHLPVPIAHGIGAGAAIELAWASRFGPPPRCRFLERANSRWRQVATGGRPVGFRARGKIGNLGDHGAARLQTLFARRCRWLTARAPPPV